MKRVRGTERERHHRKDCAAARAVEQKWWTTPWWITGASEWRRGHRWFRVECNDLACRAGFWLNERVIAEFAARAIEGSSA